MIWTATSCYSAGPIITLHGRITASDYVGISRNHVHTMVQLFFHNNDAVFQDDNSPIYKARIFQSWFEQHALQHLPWAAQTPDLNIIDTLVSFRDLGKKQIPSSIISQATGKCSS